MRCLKRTVIEWVIYVLVAAFVTCFTVGGLELRYGMDHYYTADDLQNAQGVAMSFCNQSQCLPNCTEFNSLMLVVSDNSEFIMYTCTTDCMTSCKNPLCASTCFSLWSTFQHVRSETGENGSYRYNVGTFLTVLGVVLTIASLAMCICMDELVNTNNFDTYECFERSKPRVAFADTPLTGGHPQDPPLTGRHFQNPPLTGGHPQDPEALVL